MAVKMKVLVVMVDKFYKNYNLESTSGKISHYFSEDSIYDIHWRNSYKCVTEE